MTHCILQRIVFLCLIACRKNKQVNHKRKKKLQHSDNETIIHLKIIRKAPSTREFLFFFFFLVLFFFPPGNMLQSISLLSFPLGILRATDYSAVKQKQNTRVFFTVYQKRQFKKCIALCLEPLQTLLKSSNSMLFMSIIFRGLQCLQIL